MFDSPLFWDLGLQQLLNQQWRFWGFDLLMPVISNSVVLWACTLGAFFLVRANARKMFAGILLLGVTIGISDMSCSVLKDVVGRVRPLQSIALTWHVEDGRWVQLPPDFIQTKARGSSFPSAHAANSVAAICILYQLFQRKSFWLIPLMVGYSRIYLGKHFPLDVVAGWGLGLLVGCIVWFACSYIVLKTGLSFPVSFKTAEKSETQ